MKILRIITVLTSLFSTAFPWLRSSNSPFIGIFIPSSEGEELLCTWVLTDYAQSVCSYDIPQESSFYWVRPQHGMDCYCHSKLCLRFSTVANRRCWISPFTFVSTFYRNMKRGRTFVQQWRCVLWPIFKIVYRLCHTTIKIHWRKKMLQGPVR